MRHLFLLLPSSLLLVACQPKAISTALPPTANSLTGAISKPSATSNHQNAAVGSPTSPAAPIVTAQPAVHSSSTDPNAVNLIVITDQPVINNGLTIDSISSAQAGWVVLYFDKDGKPHVFITYIAVSAGKSSQVKIFFNQNLNPSLEKASIPPAPGVLLHAVLQVGNPPPGTPAYENGHIVSVPFTILQPGQ